MPSLLITGGCGMVAQHVAEAAQARGCRTVLSDIGWDEARMWDQSSERLTFDIRDRAACEAAAKGMDAIIHCAAVVGPQRARVDPLATLAVNVTGTANLLEAAHGQGARLLNVSTATLYGHRPDLQPLDEDGPLDPLTVYDGSKRMTEVYCEVHRRTYGSVSASFRTGFVFGRGTQIGEYFLPRLLAGEAVHEAAGGDHPCDFTYVVDLAEALVAAALADRLPQTIYNVSGGALYLRRDLAAAALAAVPGATITQAPGIDPARHLRGPSRIERMKQDFGWAPRFTLAEAMLDWRGRLEAGSARSYG